MKNFGKLLGLAVLSAVIIFGFTACDDGNGDNGGGGNTTGTFTMQGEDYSIIDSYMFSFVNYSSVTVTVTAGGTTKSMAPYATLTGISDRFAIFNSSRTISGTYSPANKVRYDEWSYTLQFYDR